MRFPDLIARLDDAELEWVLHVGDIHRYPCSDEVYLDRRATFACIRNGPAVLS